MKFKKDEYADREIAHAKALLEKNPDDTRNKERVAYWYAYKGDMDSAREWATTDKALKLIEPFDGR